MAAQACACKTSACRDDIRAQWEALPAPVLKNPEKMIHAESEAELLQTQSFNSARETYYPCIEPDQSAEKMALRLKPYADQACACDASDASCLAKARQAGEQFLKDTWHGQKGSAAKQQLDNEMRRFHECTHVAELAR